jgi:hypothetical protein
MVSTDAQLYTMEGIAAGVIMILTAYLVLGSTSVYTPGDTHITDMQLEQVGSDILKIMDTPETPGVPSELEQYVYENKGAEFRTRFWDKLLMSGYIAAQNTTREGSSTFAFATVNYHYTDTWTNPGNPTSEVDSYRIFEPYIAYSGGQPGVKVTRLVKVPGKGKMPGTSVEDRPQVVLVEVFLWKA